MPSRLVLTGLTLSFSIALLHACRSATPPPAEPSQGADVPSTPAPAPAPLPEEPGAPDGAAPPGDSSGGNACSKDSDCVPAGCCHPSACVARSRAPECKAVMCTMECRPETLDCGGSCLCQNGQCAAKLNDLGKTN